MGYLDINLLDTTILPKCIKISTISATCSLGIDFKLDNMFKYLKLNKDGIITIKYKGIHKSLEPIKKSKKKKKNCFQNQMTVEIRPNVAEFPNSKISVKIFKNGSIQMSGIKSIECCNQVLFKLIRELKKEYAIIKDDVLEDVNFVNEPENIKVDKFKIDMINSGFELKYEINRDNMYNELIKNNIECRFEPSIHAGVNIKYIPPSSPKKVSIFVFESGNIIITGAKNIDSIIETYNYILNFIKSNKKIIEKNNISNLLLESIDDEIKDLISIDKDDDLLALSYT